MTRRTSRGFSRGGSREIDSCRRQIVCVPQFGVGIVMDGCQRFAFFYRVADALVKSRPTPGSMASSFFSRPPPSIARAMPNCFAICSDDVALVFTQDIDMGTRLGQTLRFVDHTFVAALQLDSLFEFSGPSR